MTDNNNHNNKEDNLSKEDNFNNTNNNSQNKNNLSETEDLSNYEKYFLKNNILFSNKRRTFNIIKEIPEIEISREENNIFENNKIIIKNIEEICEKNSKNIEINGEIENFSDLSEKIEKEYKTKKTKNIIFKKVEDDDYEFIEKTTQIEILKQLERTLNLDDIEKLWFKIKKYSEEIEDIEQNKINSILDKIKKEEEKINKIDSEIDRLKEDKILILFKKIENQDSEIERLEKKKIKLYEKNNIGIEEEKILKQIEEVQKKTKNLSFKIEENKLEIKIIKTKIQNLSDEMKLGKRKCFQPLPFILTLGIIYWTKFSDCEYIKFRLHSKINRLTEENLNIEKKIHKTQLELEDLKEKEKEEKKRISKLNEETNIKIEEIEVEISIIKKENKELRKELQKQEEKLSEKNSSISELKANLNKFIIERDYHLKNSTISIIDSFKKIRKIREENIEKIRTLRKIIENQKTNIEGEYLVFVKDK